MFIGIYVICLTELAYVSRLEGAKLKVCGHNVDRHNVDRQNEETITKYAVDANLFRLGSINPKKISCS